MKNARVETIRSVVRRIRIRSSVPDITPCFCSNAWGWPNLDCLKCEGTGWKRKEKVDTRTVVDEERE